MIADLPAVLLRHPDAATHGRVALVSVEPASAAEHILVRLATGPDRRSLGSGTAYGPFPLAEAATRLDYVVQRLRGAGYVEFSSLGPIIERLGDPSRRKRALAAINLGWRRAEESVPALLEAASKATSELSVMVDALGRIGDPRAIDLCREQAGKKLLSRRRSGVEALRALGDQEGLAQARMDGLARLPDELRALLEHADETRPSPAQRKALFDAVMALEPLRRGLVIDQLYELATPLCVDVAVRALRDGWEQPHLWRYAKSVFKRAMQREDLATFAELSLRFERRRGLHKGARAVLKSGLDGQSRKTAVFGPRTQSWVQRAAARWLRRLAYWRPALYPHAAAQVLIRYRAEDAREPRGLFGPFAHALLWYRLLHAAGPRFRVDRSSRVVARSAAAVIQSWSTEHVPFADRWDAEPLAYLELAAFAALAEARDWGVAGVLRHPQIMAHASARVLAALMDAAPALALLADAEVQRRCPSTAPDLSLCAALLDAGVMARALGERLLEASADHWIARPALVLKLLRRRQQTGRELAAKLVNSVLPTLAVAIRMQVIDSLLQALETSGGMPEERHSALVEVLLVSASEAASSRSLEQVLAWVQDGDLAQRTVGGALLGAHPQALELLGTARLVVLADAEVQTIRAAVCALVGRALSQLQSDPWPLLSLAETRFPDTRRCAFELLAQLDISRLELSALVALCDSNHAQVQDFARRWISAHLDQVNAPALLEHLIEHPHAPMRAFALELLEQHLPAGATALRGVSEFLHSSLLTPRLSRAARDRLLRLLQTRGLLDAEQGALALEVLSHALRTAVQRDFEPLVLALTRIQLAWPQLRSEWQLKLETPA